MDQAERRTASRSRFAGGKVAEVLARLGSPASDVDGRRLEREVHEALARLRTQSREHARGTPLSAERPYSELRTAETAALPKVEMSYIGE